MLVKFKMAQFGGLNTVEDSMNEGLVEARYCRNFITRPLGALGVAPAYKAFQPGGSALSLGFTNLVDYLFDVSSGAQLVIQDEASNWWDVTPQADGMPRNITVATPASPLSANLTLTSGQILAFKISSTQMIRGGADLAALGSFYQGMTVAPYATTTYTTQRAFNYGFGIVFPADGAGNTWKLISGLQGLVGVTV